MDPLYFDAMVSVSSPYTNQLLPEFANIARINNELELFRCTDHLVRYLSINNAPGYIDKYIHSVLSYNCACYAISKEQYNILSIPNFTFNPYTFQIHSGKTATSDFVIEYKSVLDGIVVTLINLHFCLYSNATVEGLELLLELIQRLLKKGGSVVIELQGIEEEKELIAKYVALFGEAYLFKPISSDLFSYSRYLVLKNYGHAPSVKFDYEAADKEIRDEVNKIREDGVPHFNQALIYAGCSLMK